MTSLRDMIASGLDVVRNSYWPASDERHQRFDGHLDEQSRMGWDDGWSADRVVIDRVDPIPSTRFPSRLRPVVSVYAASVASVFERGGGLITAPPGPLRTVDSNPPNAKPHPRLSEGLAEEFGGFQPCAWEDGSVTFLVAMPDEPPWVQ